MKNNAQKFWQCARFVVTLHGFKKNEQNIIFEEYGTSR